MKKGYTRSLMNISLLAIAMCFSFFAGATCVSSAQWTYANPSGDSAAFSSVDTAAVYHHIWTYGDGTSDSAVSAPGHTYAAAGTYQVCLIVYVPNTSCADTFCQSVTVGDTCGITAAWTSIDLGGDSIRFTAADTNNAATYYWNFGDGSFAFSTTLTTHHYSAAGIYHVCFYVTRGVCADSLCQSVTVTPDTCGLLATWSYGNSASDSVTFSATNTDTTVTHIWNFGDGAFATGIDTTHTYSASGFYTACLYLHAAGTNCYDTICQSISVGSNPCGITPDWTYTTHGGDSVRFIASDSNSAATHQWNFGDGTFATGTTNTSHHYSAPGTYHVCFYVYIAGTICSDSFCQNVVVTTDTCGLDPTWHTLNPGGDSLIFIANDTNSLALAVWSFGDGTYGAGSTDTIHHYAAGGSYTACLYLSLPGTGCSDTLCQSITAGAPLCPVTADFNAYLLGGDSALFEAADTVSSATHVWNLGDGTYAYGTTNVSHTYAGPGTYHICFYAYILGTTCSDSLCQDITVTSDTCHITSYWTTSALGGDSMSFTAADTNSSAEHIWVFGDGDSANAMLVNHTYPSAGTYVVCLHVLKPGTACNDSLCQQVTVTSSPPCSLSAVWASAPAGNDSLRFTASDTGSTVTRIWQFGDGRADTGAVNILHHYASAGSYTACLYVSIAGTGCIDSLCQSVTVTGSVPCNMTAAWTSVSVGNDSIRFTASDTNSSATHIWKFGDGTTASGTTSTTHHYNSAGTYTVCFYVSMPGTNCSDSLCQSVTVTGTPPCNITAAWTWGVTGIDSIAFAAGDTNSTATHLWKFGDGNEALGTTNTIHQYASPGTYTVCFYVSIPGTGCSDSLCQQVTVIADTTVCNITAAWTYTMITADSFVFAAADTNSLADHNWSFGDGTLVNGQTIVSHVFGATGSYSVCFNVYIPSTNCFDSLCQTVDVVLGIDPVSASSANISIEPNPFSQSTLIKVYGAVQPYTLHVYDLVGKELRREASSGNVFIFERGDLASGLYMYEVTTGNTTISKGKMIAE